MSTYGQWLKNQSNRDDRVGWASRKWSELNIARVHSPTGIARHLAKQAAECDAESRQHWELAVQGNEEAYAEYQRENAATDAESHGLVVVKPELANNGPNEGNDQASRSNVVELPGAGTTRLPSAPAPDSVGTRLIASQERFERLEQQNRELLGKLDVVLVLVTAMAAHLGVQSGDVAEARESMAVPRQEPAGITADDFARMWNQADLSG